MPESKPTPARTTFTKQYVKERIAARMASLRSKIAADQKIVDDWWKATDDKLKDILNDRRIQLEELNKLYKKSAKKFSEGKNPIERYKALQLFDSSESFTQLPYIPPGRDSYHSSDIEKAQARLQESIHELGLLEHTLAYFEESPVEEYSITALQKLGLLEAVKFSITVPTK